MSTPSHSILLPSKRTRNTSVLWMLFSAIWAGILFVGLVQYWRIPENSIYDTPVSIGFKLLATVLVTVFVGIYGYTLYRMYFRRSSWLTVFSTAEFWWIRGALLGISIQLNILPSSDNTGWHSAFVFAAIGWALTSNHQNAIGAVFQVAVVAAGILLIACRQDIVVGTMLYIVGFGVMVAGYVMMNGLIGELMIERGRVRDQAVTDERFRLARDLHATVGHSMTQITLKAELARKLLGSDSSRAATELVDIESLSRDLSSQVRQSIAGEVGLTFAQELDRAAALLDSMDISIDRQIEVKQLPTHVDAALAWCTREGVMNVIKHSGASHCQIRLQRASNDFVFAITDNGSISLSESTGGQGIVGMKSRLQSLGGSLVFASNEEGHTLEVRIPV